MNVCLYIGAITLVWTGLTSATGRGFRCKWSNEGCSSNNECCSESCVQSHPGTNPRCTKSTIRRPCLYNHHCENRLVCGDSFKCCADYWETCAKAEECCNPNHQCLSTLGFVYRKCLEGPVKFRRTGTASTFKPRVFVLLLMNVVVYTFYNL